jgi:squalene-hopene/tetraprenyl-beta-curcumene cyclase
MLKYRKVGVHVSACQVPEKENMLKHELQVAPHMTHSNLRARLVAARDKAVGELLAERSPDGHWVGELSSSALSTATAVCALALAGKGKLKLEHQPLIQAGLRWLAEHANADGGWGDTDQSISNVSTTTLVWAAFGIVPGAAKEYPTVVARAEQWLSERAGSLAPGALADAIAKRYGRDRTFSVPILTTCALAGRLGPARQAWRFVPQLPFELAALPHQCYSAVRLPVVSYALPALIAIGQARHHFQPTRNPVARWIRNTTRDRTLEILTSIQPTSGGFLEATPLTSFLTMSLAAMGLVDHPVTKRGVEFLKKSARPDGSWPIDTNLATWLTTLSINAGVELPEAERRQVAEWLLNQQYQVEHPYTHAAPGGWAWTDLPGGVPDADDTAGALVALRALSGKATINREHQRAATAGITWLLNLQNRDGGIPTFCRGWGALPFDRSGPDLTAHALRAWLAWRDGVAADVRRRIDRAVQRAVDYLTATQRADGAWLPLWFGHEQAPDDENPLYGTANVLSGLAAAQQTETADVTHLIERGTKWLLDCQRADGGWSGARDGESSVEETGLAVAALSAVHGSAFRVQGSLKRGLLWLIERVEEGRWREASPIGFYFARLWYYERLYPMIFATDALTRAVSQLSLR